jgi:hypothetical protein
MAGAALWCSIVLGPELVFAGQAGMGREATAPPVLSTTPTPPPGAVPEPGSMSGRPLQVGDLAPGTVAVRVIVGDFTNNVTDHPVELRVESNPKPLTSTTGADGRAVFVNVTVGTVVQASTVVNGDHLESQRFEIPPLGGVRLVLVGGSSEQAQGETASARAISQTLPYEADQMSTTAKVGFVAGMWTLAIGLLVVFRRAKRP